MNKLLVTAMLLTFTSSAWATNSCLEDATNSELINELSHRLYTDDPGGDVMISSTCSSWDLSINALNLENGSEKSVKFSVGTSSKCDALSARINQRFANKAINKSVMIASCSSWTLKRVLIKKNGELKKLVDQNQGTSDKCEAEASRINNNW